MARRAGGLPDREWTAQAHLIKPKVGVCLSGGGIRSASFCLGALQAIARSRLDKVRYVTSVSGGGYMAAAWAALTRPNESVEPFRPFQSRSPEERWVRHHTDYLVSSGGVVLGSVLSLVAGLFFNLLIVFTLLQVVAHPLGWAVGAAHPELRANEPIVEIRNQARFEIAGVELVDDARVPTEETCDGCVPARRSTTAYVVRLRQVAGDGLEVASAARVEDTPDDRARRAPRLLVEPGLVAEGVDGLTVVRQPVLRMVDDRLSDDDLAVASLLDIATQPRIAVDALPEGSAGQQGDPRLAEVVEELVRVDRQPRLEQGSGTLGRDDLAVQAWMVWVLVVLLVVTVVTFVLDPRIFRKRTARHVVSQGMGKLLVAALALLVLLPLVARNLPDWVASVPGYDRSATEWRAVLAFLVAVVPLLVRFRGSLGKRKALQRFRGKGIVLDGLLGVIVLVLGLATFVALLDLAVANGPGGRLSGVHDGWMFGLADIWRWLIAVGLLAVFLVAPMAAHSWSLYSVYQSGLATAYFLRAEPERGDRRRHRIARMTGHQRGEWSWAPAATREEGLRGLSNPEELRHADVDTIEEWVVCTTANVRGSGEAAPGRAAGSFTFSRSWVGGPEVGWMRTPDYLRALHAKRKKLVSVPATVTISGAAFSPAMGKDSKGWQGRLFALGNLRLGVWVPNPMVVRRRNSVDHTWGRWRPPSVRWYLRELVGWFDRTASYVYLTDGGHWENLGLVELLRRGCTDVWMISAAGDGTYSFETMAQAMALAREELGVEFDGLELEPLRAPTEPDAGSRRLVRDDKPVPTAPKAFATGRFRYPSGVTGTIHVVEAALLGDLPWDVHGYAEGNDDFPDIPTGYQLMNHRDFEAYRMLGYVQTARALRDVDLWPDATDPVLS